jgi:osmoprotectant transport system permease protein
MMSDATKADAPREPKNAPLITTLAIQHTVLSFSALAIAIVVAIPLGALVARRRVARTGALGALGVLRVIPSLALLTLALPYLGIGFAPSLLALVVLAVPTIAINTIAGLEAVPAATEEAARGLGMTPAQVRARVAWPTAIPVVFAGVRGAAVEVIASASLAAFVGGGGLGELVIDGLANNDGTELIGGGAAIAALALATDAVLATIEHRLNLRYGRTT